MTATLLLAWRFDSGASQIVDFAADGEMSILIREIAAHIEIVDGAAAFYRGIAGDFERMYLEERSKRIEAEQHAWGITA